MFKEIEGIKDLINSEGFKIRLVRRTDVDLDQADLYIEAKNNKDDRKRILCRINPETLKLYLNGRIRTKELFLVRSDEPFILLKSCICNEQKAEFINFSEKIKAEIDQLVFSNNYYTDITWRTYKDADEVIRIINLFW